LELTIRIAGTVAKNGEKVFERLNVTVLASA
jgi:hypothetical protein